MALGQNLVEDPPSELISQRSEVRRQKAVSSKQAKAERAEARGQMTEVKSQFFMFSSVLKFCVHLPAMLRNLSAIALAQARRAGARRAGLCPDFSLQMYFYQSVGQ